MPPGGDNQAVLAHWDCIRAAELLDAFFLAGLTLNTALTHRHDTAYSHTIF